MYVVVKRAAVIGLVATATMAFLASAQAANHKVHHSHKIQQVHKVHPEKKTRFTGRAPANAFAEEVGAPHGTCGWRYYGGPKGGLWPTPCWQAAQ